MEDMGDCSSRNAPGSLSLSFSSSSLEWSDRNDSVTEADDRDGSAALEPSNTSPRLDLRLRRKILVKKKR